MKDLPARLEYEIVTPDGVLASGQADEVVVPGSQGAFGVRPGHARFASTIDRGYLSVRVADSSLDYYVAQGLVQVGPERVVVCVREGNPRQENPNAA